MAGTWETAGDKTAASPPKAGSTQMQRVPSTHSGLLPLLDSMPPSALPPPVRSETKI